MEKNKLKYSAIEEDILKEINNINEEINSHFTNCKIDIFADLKKLLNDIFNKLNKENINRKEIMKIFLGIRNEIKKSEKNIEFSKYIEWTWFIFFAGLREKIDELYYEIFDGDIKDASIISFIEEIIENWYEYFEFNLLDEKEKEQYKSKNWYMHSPWISEKYPKAIINFKNIDEILKYIEENNYFKF